MGKTIYWIDDDIQQMVSVMQGVFPELWKVKDKEATDAMVTKIIIFGNSFQEDAHANLYSKRDEVEFQHKMEYFLKQKCVSSARATWDTTLYQAKRELIKNGVKILFKISGTEVDNAEGRKDELKFYREIREYWGEELHQNEKPNGEQVKRLIEMMGIPEGEIVCIDLNLLAGDIERVKAEKCIISMELYHQLKEKHICFLYSSWTFDGPFVRMWKENYKKIYEIDEDLKIYRKCELDEKGDKSMLADILKENTKGGGVDNGYKC